MAIKDVFKGFFVVEDEDQNEEIYSSEQSRPARIQQMKEEQVIPDPAPQRKTQVKTQGKTEKKTMAKPQVVNIRQETQVSSKVCLFEPRVFSDTQDIADELKNRRATLVNLQRIDKVSAKRIIDFLSGTVYAIGGDIQRIGQDIFLCTPDNVEVAGSITEMLDAPEER